MSAEVQLLRYAIQRQFAILLSDSHCYCVNMAMFVVSLIFSIFSVAFTIISSGFFFAITAFLCRRFSDSAEFSILFSRSHCAVDDIER
jgi:hypothetical protein